MKTLVNIHVALRTVKEKKKQALLFHFLFFFFIEVKGGTVLIHKNEKEFWFIIETNVRFFFSLLKSNFHNFFHYCENEKKDDSRFPNQIYRLLKHIKRKLI